MNFEVNSEEPGSGLANQHLQDDSPTNFFYRTPKKQSFATPTPQFSGLSPTTIASFGFGGFGGLFVDQHYNKVLQLDQDDEMQKQISMIAPALGTEDYMSWLKRNGAKSNLKLKEYVRPKSVVNLTRKQDVIFMAKRTSKFGTIQQLQQQKTVQLQKQKKLAQSASRQHQPSVTLPIHNQSSKKLPKEQSLKQIRVQKKSKLERPAINQTSTKKIYAQTTTKKVLTQTSVQKFQSEKKQVLMQEKQAKQQSTNKSTNRRKILQGFLSEPLDTSIGKDQRASNYRMIEIKPSLLQTRLQKIMKAQKRADEKMIYMNNNSQGEEGEEPTDSSIIESSSTDEKTSEASQEYDWRGEHEQQQTVEFEQKENQRKLKLLFKETWNDADIVKNPKYAAAGDNAGEPMDQIDLNQLELSTSGAKRISRLSCRLKTNIIQQKLANKINQKRNSENVGIDKKDEIQKKLEMITNLLSFYDDQLSSNNEPQIQESNQEYIEKRIEERSRLEQYEKEKQVSKFMTEALFKAQRKRSQDKTSIQPLEVSPLKQRQAFPKQQKITVEEF